MLGARGIYYGGYPWRDLGIVTAADLNAAISIAMQEPSSFTSDQVIGAIPDGSLSNSKLMFPYVTIGTTVVPLGPSGVRTISGMSPPVDPGDVATKFYVDNVVGLEGYTAGVGLNLIGNQFNIAQTGVVAGTFGSSSAVPQITVNAQGQITHAGSVAISMTAQQLANGTTGNGLVVLNQSPTFSGSPLFTGNMQVNGAGIINFMVLGPPGSGSQVNFTAGGNAWNVAPNAGGFLSSIGFWTTSMEIVGGNLMVDGALTTGNNLQVNINANVNGSINAGGPISAGGNINGWDHIVNGTGIYFVGMGNGGYYQLRWDGSSLYCWVNNYGFIGLATPSGLAIKRGIRAAESGDALTAIRAIPMYSYDAPQAGKPLDDDGNWTGTAHHELGWAAEDLEKLIPNSVSRLRHLEDPSQPDVLHPQWQPILAYVVRAIQQLAERVETLDAKR